MGGVRVTQIIQDHILVVIFGETLHYNFQGNYKIKIGKYPAKNDGTDPNGFAVHSNFDEIMDIWWKPTINPVKINCKYIRVSPLVFQIQINRLKYLTSDENSHVSWIKLTCLW